MDRYAYISAIAVFFYISMLLVFMASKRTKTIRAFLMTLISMACWTGGSCFMRLQAWPDYRFWYHVSLLSILIMPYAYYRLVNVLAEKETGILDFVYPFADVVLFLLNIPNGVFLRWPDIVQTESGEIFKYDITWQVAFFFAVDGIIIIHTLVCIFQYIKEDNRFKKALESLLVAIIILLAGNVAILIPAFSGFPVDILSGVINAFFIIYALAQKNMFKTTLLVSENMCYGVGFLISVLLFWVLSPYMNDILDKFVPADSKYKLVFAAVLFTIVVQILKKVWKQVINNVFIKDENQQDDVLKNFSTDVVTSLNLQDILGKFVKAVTEGCKVRNVYISVNKGEKKGFKMLCSSNPLHDMSLTLKYDNPLVKWIEKNPSGAFLEEFYHSIEYKSMWETEKRQLEKMDTTWCIGLRNDDGLTGIVFVSDKEGNKGINSQDVSFLNALATVSSFAIKNASLYEKMAEEARTDELTGVYNRKYFYEKLHERFEECKLSSIVLVLINVDDFKLYNQLYGMKVGDQALVSITEIIKATVGTGGDIARYGAKEFAIILPGYDVYGAKTLVENICAQIGNMNQENDDVHLKRLTVSVGISVAPYAAHTEKELVDNADLAVYYVKHSGKNNTYIYDIALQNKNSAVTLENMVHRHREYDSTIYALTAAIDAKDHYTFGHSNNVMYYATTFAKCLEMDDEMVEIIRQAALMHDVGKIGIPEHILSKPGKLTDEEYEIMKGHVEAAIDIIKHLPALDYVIPAVIGHHERYDGKGYPRRIAGEDIPLSARILCICDSFDAMISDRCYNSPQPLESVIAILQKEAGHQFDPKLVTAFIECLRDGKIDVIYSAPRQKVLMG